MLDNTVSAAITFVMLYYGVRLQKRIRKSSAFEQGARDGILRQIVGILTFMTICQLVRLVGVSIILLPSFNQNMVDNPVVRYVEEHQLLFALVGFY